MTTHEITKALEVWTLQSLLNVSIMLGILSLGLSIIQKYLRSLEQYLSLKVSIELWRITTTIIVDILLIIVVLVGYTVLNPDIMADIKMAVPFAPVATILFSLALIIRLFYGGHQLTNPNFTKAVRLLAVANAINMVGFTFVMEAPSTAYLETHPSASWTFLKMYLRSNSNLELSQITFWICFPVLVVVFIWGLFSALRQLNEMKRAGHGS